MTYNQILVPVADAGPAPSSRASGAAESTNGGGVFCAVLTGWVLFHFSNFGLIPGLDAAIKLIATARYFLWPTILAALGFHLGRTGGRDFMQSLAPVAPFFVIGVVSGVIGFDPIESARLLIFWVLGVIGAAVVGLDMTPKTFRRVLMVVFAAMVVASIAFALVKPEFGVSTDNRAAGGNAWRGFFPGKNQLGLICVYGLLITIFVEGWPRFVKMGLFVMFAAVLFFARSQGAIAAAMAMVIFCVFVTILRRMPLNASARSTFLVLGVVLGAVTVALGYTFVSDLLGRDTTLTGRTEIWPLWLARAVTNWPIGYGPGSFTETSLVTIDLTASEIGLGTIHTPHNMFIAIFGEVGLFGLVAYLAALLYFAFVLPFTRSSSAAFFAAATAFTTLVSGMSETREVFGQGMNMFLVIAAYASSRRRDSMSPAAIAPPPPSPAPSGIIALGTWR